MESYRLTDEKLLDLKDKIDIWKTANKEIIMIHLADDPFDGIFKVPSSDHMKLASTHTSDLDKNKALCLECILHPSPEIFQKILEDRSGIVVPIATQLVRAAGTVQEATVKKL